MTSRILSLVLAAVASLAGGTALAQSAAPQDALYVKALAATCANCHGTNGQVRGSDVKGLAGVPAANIVALMAAYKAGSIPNTTIMHQIAKGYTDDQIKLIAGYFAAQKPAQK